MTGLFIFLLAVYAARVGMALSMKKNGHRLSPYKDVSRDMPRGDTLEEILQNDRKYVKENIIKDLERFAFLPAVGFAQIAGDGTDATQKPGRFTISIWGWRTATEPVWTTVP